MSTTGMVSANLMRMAATPATASADAAAMQKHLKLQDAAERFEGMMLQELLKPMQEGKSGSFGGFGGGFGSEDEDRDDSLDTMSSFGTEAVANAIAKAGGVGIAKQVMREVGALDADVAGNRGAGGGAGKGPKAGPEGYRQDFRSQNGNFGGKLKKLS